MRQMAWAGAVQRAQPEQHEETPQHEWRNTAHLGDTTQLISGRKTYRSRTKPRACSERYGSRVSASISFMKCMNSVFGCGVCCGGLFCGTHGECRCLAGEAFGCGSRALCLAEELMGA